MRAGARFVLGVVAIISLFKIILVEAQGDYSTSTIRRNLVDGSRGEQSEGGIIAWSIIGALLGIFAIGGIYVGFLGEENRTEADIEHLEATAQDNEAAVRMENGESGTKKSLVKAAADKNENEEEESKTGSAKGVISKDHPSAQSFTSPEERKTDSTAHTRTLAGAAATTESKTEDNAGNASSDAVATGEQKEHTQAGQGNIVDQSDTKDSTLSDTIEKGKAIVGDNPEGEGGAPKFETWVGGDGPGGGDPKQTSKSGDENFTKRGADVKVNRDEKSGEASALKDVDMEATGAPQSTGARSRGDYNLVDSDDRK